MLRLLTLTLSLLAANAMAANQYSLPGRTLNLPSNADFPATYEISAELKRQKVAFTGDNARVAQVELRIKDGTPGATVGLFLGRSVVDSVVLSDSAERTITLKNHGAKSLIPWIVLIRKGEMQILEMRVTLDAGEGIAAPAPAPAPAPSKPVEEPKPAPKPVPEPAPVPAPVPPPAAPSTSGPWSIGQALYYVDSVTSRALTAQVAAFAPNSMIVVKLDRGQQITVREDSNRLARISKSCVRDLCPGDRAVSADSLGRPQTLTIVAFQNSRTAVIRAERTGELIGNWPIYALHKR